MTILKDTVSGVKQTARKQSIDLATAEDLATVLKTEVRKGFDFKGYSLLTASGADSVRPYFFVATAAKLSA